MGDGRMTRETGVGFFCKETPKPRGVIFLQGSGWGVGNEGCGDSLKETKSRGVVYRGHSIALICLGARRE